MILSTSESIALVDKQRYWASAGEVVSGDLGIFHAASTGGLVQGVCARTGGLVQGVCAVHIGSDVVQFGDLDIYRKHCTVFGD